MVVLDGSELIKRVVSAVIALIRAYMFYLLITYFLPGVSAVYAVGIPVLAETSWRFAWWRIHPLRRFVIYDVGIQQVWARLDKANSGRARILNRVQRHLEHRLAPYVPAMDAPALVRKVWSSSFLDSGSSDDDKFWDSYSGTAVMMRQHLDHSYGWKDWEFAALLLRGGAVKVSPEGGTSHRGAALHVDLHAADVGIVSNRGKKWLRQRSQQNPAQNIERCKVVERRVSEALEGDGPYIVDPDMRFRWASGGSLAVARWQRPGDGSVDAWFIFHYRGIDPIGWNISNGASESEGEWTEPSLLSIRETIEELVVLAEPVRQGAGIVRQRRLTPHIPHLHSLEKSVRERVLSDEFLEEHHRLRFAHDGLVFEYVGDPVELRVVRTSDRVVVTDPDGDVHPCDDVLFSVNPFELGLEVLKVFEFDMHTGDQLLFGEVWPHAECLIREPVIAIRVEALREHFAGGTWESLREMVRLGRSDYHVFAGDIELREQRGRVLREKREAGSITRQERDELEALIESWQRQSQPVFVRDYPYTRLYGDADSEGEFDSELVRRAWTLCPVAAKAIHGYFTRCET